MKISRRDALWMIPAAIGGVAVVAAYGMSNGQSQEREEEDIAPVTPPVAPTTDVRDELFRNPNEYLLPDVALDEITEAQLATLPTFTIGVEGEPNSVAQVWGFRPGFNNYRIAPFEEGYLVYIDRNSANGDYKSKVLNEHTGIFTYVVGENEGRSFGSNQGYLAVQVTNPNYECGILLDTQKPIQELRKVSPHFPEFLQEHVSMDRGTAVQNDVMAFDLDGGENNGGETVRFNYWPLNCQEPVVIPGLDLDDGISNIIVAIRRAK